MTMREKINSMNNEEFVEWLENALEAYVRFWVDPDFKYFCRDEDKEIQLKWLSEEWVEKAEFA